ncbi:MAG: GSU3473 family protein [Nitrospirota bacterium]
MMLRVIYKNGKHDMINPSFLDKLIISGQLRSFLRSEGWVAVGIGRLRGSGGDYSGPERRKSFKYSI